MAQIFPSFQHRTPFVQGLVPLPAQGSVRQRSHRHRALFRRKLSRLIIFTLLQQMVTRCLEVIRISTLMYERLVRRPHLGVQVWKARRLVDHMKDERIRELIRQIGLQHR